MPELLRPPGRVVRSPVVDSRRWQAFEPRDDDIVIATYPKCGTTWTQRIVDCLVFQSPDVRPFGDLSPWLDATIFNSLEDDIATLKAQTHRRYVKAHLPFDALPLWDTVKYIHVGRDGRDARVSWQNHMQGATPELLRRIGEQAGRLAAEQTNGKPPERRVPPPDNPRTSLVQWLDEMENAPPDVPGTGELTYFGFESTWWRERTRPNLLLVHYNDLKRNLAAEMRRISDFLGIATPDALMPKLVEAASFEFMKEHGNALFPRLKMAFDRGADRFINRGVSGRWREFATAEDAVRYEAIARRRGSPGMTAWLEHGRRGSVDPRLAPD